MVTLEWDLDRTDGVTLVRLFVGSERRCRVRIENRLDGPVWPPRQQGRPASGWDDDEYTGVVPADGRLTVGYATPAGAAEPPAEVVETTAVEASETTTNPGSVTDPSERATDGGRGGDGTGPRDPDVPSVESTPDGVVRSLGDPVIPRDAVPVGAVRRNGNGKAHGNRCRNVNGTKNGGADDAGSGVRSGGGVARGDARNPPRAAGDTRGASRAAAEGDEDPAFEAPLVVPGAVRAWLRDVERRLDAVADDDPVEGDLTTVVGADRRALSWVSRRAETLAARTERGEKR